MTARMRILHVRVEPESASRFAIRASLEDGPAADASVSLPAQFKPIQLGSGSVDSITLEATGRALHTMLCSPQLQPVWAEAAAEPGRIVLDIGPPELRVLPWELLFDDSRQQWLFGDERRPWARTVALPFAEIATPMQLPVRMLVLIGAPGEEDRVKLGVDDELAAIYAAVRDLGCLWQIEVLYGADMPRLRRRFADIAPHILHVIGHGMRDDRGRPALEVAEAGQVPWPLTAEFVQNALAGAPAPRLVVLNACRTAEQGVTPQCLVEGVTSSFLNRDGAGAVVSMQGDVEAPAAVLMSGAFYAAIAQGCPVDVAMARAHNDLHWSQGLRTGDWALPTLTLRAHPDRVLESEVLANANETMRQHGGGVLEDLRWLVDRTCERQNLLRGSRRSPAGRCRPRSAITSRSSPAGSRWARPPSRVRARWSPGCVGCRWCRWTCPHRSR